MRLDTVCGECARRTWLLAALAGHLDAVRARIDDLIMLEDTELIAAVGGSDAAALEHRRRAFDPAAAARERERVGLHAVCRCASGYPGRLRDLPAPPAVLHLLGDPNRLRAIADGETVAIVGARRATAYGSDVASRLAGGSAAAGVPVISGLALGIDGAAHTGAVSAGGLTVAILAGSAEIPYPASHRRLHGQVATTGLVVSELGPGVRPRRWMFPARNRIIAALSTMTVVVQARERSGALVTARWAAQLGRGLGAVPGAVTAPLSAGPHGLLAGGAQLVATPQDVLDGIYGAGRVIAARGQRPGLEPELRELLDALADGETGERAFARAGLGFDGGLAALAALELAGAVRRAAGGRWVVAW